MSTRRISTLFLTLLLCVINLTCRDISEPLTPVEPQFAKGGIPAAPKDPIPVNLREYYVYQDEGLSGEVMNFVHILAEGTFPRVNLNVVQDYFHDGIRNNDLYYEYTTAAPLPAGEEDFLEGGQYHGVGVWDWDEAAGAWHIDIPWNGETFYRIYPDPETDPDGVVERVPIWFPDFPQIDGDDPYTFDVRFQTEEGDYIDYYRPKGIILAGAERGKAVEDITGLSSFHSGTVRSFASYSGTGGNPIYIQDSNLDESSFACEVTTIRTGTGKNKTTETVTDITVYGRVILSPGTEADPAPGWITVMFATDSNNGLTLHDTFATTHGSDAWANGWGARAQIPGDVSADPIRFAVVYVYATDLKNREVYDPNGNLDTGDLWDDEGWFTVSPDLNWNDDNKQPLEFLEPFPIALTAPLNLDCGG